MIRRTVAVIGVLLLVCASAYSQENAVPDEEYLGVDAAVGRPGIAAEAAEEFVPPPVPVAEQPVSNIFVKLASFNVVFSKPFSENLKVMPLRYSGASNVGLILCLKLGAVAPLQHTMPGLICFCAFVVCLGFMIAITNESNPVDRGSQSIFHISSAYVA